MHMNAEIFDREIGINDVIFFLWKQKKKIGIVTLAFMIVGAVYAIIQENQYQSEAVISIPDDKKSSGGGFGLGGALVSQLGGGSSALSSFQTILEGRGIARRIIEKEGLLPLIYSDMWDSKNGAWKEEWDPEKMCEVDIYECAADIMRKRWVSVSLDTRRDQLRIRLTTPSKELSRKVANSYLWELNLLLREVATKSSEANRIFLYDQLASTDDPTLRQSILDFVSKEIARSTILKSQAFEILQEPTFPLKRHKPNRRQLVMMFAFLGFGMAVGGLFAYEYVRSLRAAWQRRKN